MPAERGEVWQIDFGMAAKVRPALLLTGEPADEELDPARVLTTRDHPLRSRDSLRAFSRFRSCGSVGNFPRTAIQQLRYKDILIVRLPDEPRAILTWQKRDD